MSTDMAAIKKRITAFKGHFTRLEYKIRALKCVGNTTTAADTLKAMEEKTEAMMEPPPPALLNSGNNVAYVRIFS